MKSEYCRNLSVITDNSEEKRLKILLGKSIDTKKVKNNIKI